ncbi:hypothetical protein GFPCMMHI_02849 [Ensifer adhaerens]|nr:hypothetical protein [Ensifer adhaerens]
MFVKAIPESDYLAGATKIKLRDDRSAIIAPGSNLLMFDIMPLLDQNQSYRNSLEMLQLIIQQKEPPKTDLMFEFGDSDGNLQFARLPLNAEKLFELMRANSDRCSAIATPDFENGCIGPGQIEMAPDEGGTKAPRPH